MERIVISGAKVVDPATALNEARDLLVESGRIVGIEKPGTFSSVEDTKEIKAAGLTCLPGLVDVHVHLRDPGQEWKESIETGLRSAVAGGVTSVCCMANTKPVNDNAQVTNYMLGKAKACGYAHLYPYGAITKGLEGELLADMAELYEAGVRGFSDDGRPVLNPLVLKKAMEYSLMFGLPLCLHEEDTCLCKGCSMNESALSLELGLKGMPNVAEDVLVARDIELCRHTRSKVHFCHISSARSVELIRRAKNDGIDVSAEACPHHFVLTEEFVRGFNTNAKMSPPLRKEEDLQALWDGLNDGTIDIIASDHAPHDKNLKDVEFPEAAFGIIGLQTLFGLAMKKVDEGKLGYMKALSALTVNPGRRFGLPAGEVKVGASADLVLVDFSQKPVFSLEGNQSRSSNSPFFGFELGAKVVKTFVSGREMLF